MTTIKKVLCAVDLTRASHNAGCAMGRAIEAIGTGGFERSIQAVASCACRHGVILQRNPAHG